jgi:hypothetical protein
MAAYVSVQVRDGTTDLMCPHMGECGGHATDAEVQSLLVNDSALVEKYLRFKETKANPNMRLCPKCAKWCYGSKERPEMQCDGCGQKFCFLHDMAHADGTCADYAIRVRKEERETDQLVKKTSRPCPSCHVMTTKNGGCNHMTCLQCKENWCWLCGRVMGDGHYDLTNLLGCPGAQFADDTEGIRRYFRCIRLQACSALCGNILQCLVNVFSAGPYLPFLALLFLAFGIGILISVLVLCMIFVVSSPYYLWLLATRTAQPDCILFLDSSDPRQEKLKEIWGFAIYPGYFCTVMVYCAFQLVWFLCLLPLTPFIFCYFGVGMCDLEEVFDSDTAIYKLYFFPLHFAVSFITVMTDDD